MASKKLNLEISKWVKAISILTYAIAVFLIILGFMFAKLAFQGGNIATGVIGTLLLIGGGIYSLLAARKLGLKKESARKAVIAIYAVLALLSFVIFETIFDGAAPSEDMLLMVSSFIFLAVCLAVLFYLIKSREIFS